MKYDYWALVKEILRDNRAEKIFKMHYDALTLEQKIIIDKEMEGKYESNT